MLTYYSPLQVVLMKNLEQLARYISTVIILQIEQNDEEILSVLRAQSQRASRSHQELTDAKCDVSQLHNTMKSILEEANMTQAKVDVICKDIRAMDHAKRHLTQSISVLENFGTLTDALTDLKESSNDRCVESQLHASMAWFSLIFRAMMLQGPVRRECIKAGECVVSDGKV